MTGFRDRVRAVGARPAGRWRGATSPRSAARGGGGPGPKLVAAAGALRPGAGGPGAEGHVSEPRPRAVLHEDAQLLAVDKPPGRLVIPGRRPGRAVPARGAGRRARAALGGPPARPGHERRPGLRPHRRGPPDAQPRLRRGEPRKRYLALVAGGRPPRWRVDVALAPARKGRMRPARPGDPRGKPSATLFRLLEPFAPRPGPGGRSRWSRRARDGPDPPDPRPPGSRRPPAGRRPGLRREGPLRRPDGRRCWRDAAPRERSSWRTPEGGRWS